MKNPINNIKDNPIKLDNAVVDITHPNPSRYQISINTQKEGDNLNLLLFQSYNQGWKAYEIDNKFAESFPFIFGKELKDHYLVNNWANGWMLDKLTNNSSSNKDTNIVIVYWPQYLEFAGFGLLLIYIFGIILHRKFRTNNE